MSSAKVPGLKSQRLEDILQIIRRLKSRTCVARRRQFARKWCRAPHGLHQYFDAVATDRAAGAP